MAGVISIADLSRSAAVDFLACFVMYIIADVCEWSARIGRRASVGRRALVDANIRPGVAAALGAFPPAHYGEP
jgi:hypothetical protein